MAPPIANHWFRSARASAASVACWTLWLGLALLLAGQIYVASTRELEVPGFAIRAIEMRLGASGMHATFGRTVFDPSGRVLVQDVRVTLASFEEPVLTARAVYVLLDPWALAVGRFEPLDLRVTGLSLWTPSMLSASGRSEEVVRDLDAELLMNGGDLKVEYLSARVGNLAVLAHGAMHLGGYRRDRTAPLPLAELLARNFAAYSREFAAAIQRLGVLDGPILEANLTPTPSGGASADLTLLASGLRLAEPADLQATDLQAAARVPILGRGQAPLEIDLAAADLRLPKRGAARGLRARIRGLVDLESLRLKVRAIDLAATSAEAEGATIDAPFATLEPGPQSKLRVEACGWLMNFPMAVGIDADLKARSADLRFDGDLAPALLDFVSARIGRNLRKFVAPATPAEVSGGAQFGPDWKFGRVTARVATRDLKVMGVEFDEAKATVNFDGRRLTAPEAWVRMGDNFARGSYEQDAATRDYRFLLGGRLRPLAIAPWFTHWWPALFGNFEFPVEPPAASVDLRGRWTDGRRTSVFVEADSAQPVIRGAAFDRVRTRLFIRPNSVDGLELVAVRGEGSARATFVRQTDSKEEGGQSLDFDGTSTLDLREAAKILGPTGVKFAAHVVSDRPPVWTIKGRYESSKPGGDPHRAAHIDFRSDGPFQFYDWPLDRVAFTGDLRDDDLKLDPVVAAFAGGAVTGRLEIKGRGPDRQVAFAAACSDAGLAEAIAAAEGYLAERKRARPLATTAFLRDKANVRFDLNVSAEGRYDDPYSYQGAGRMSLEGSELGEVRMLGLLSELLRFTSLRFTSARGDFQVAGRKLVFPDVNVTGANSRINAHGSYALDRHELDFNAKIYPFKQSKLLPEKLVGAVLTPLSNVFEVRLTGSLQKPSWKLANGPSNLLRNLAPPPTAGAKPPPPPVPPSN